MTAARLTGWRVLVTRQPEQAGGLTEALVREGATVVEVPLIETLPPADPEPLRDAVSRIQDYDWIVFTSANAVRAVAGALAGRDLPEGLRIAAVGSSTARAVSQEFRGATVGLTPAEARAEGLVAAFAVEGVRGRRILLPLSAIARDTLAVGLAELGARVEVVTAYRTATPVDAPARLATALASSPDVVLLASPSAVRGFVSSCPAGVAPPSAVVIGPVTEQAAREAGLRVVGVAGEAGPSGLADVLARLTRPV